MRLSYRETALIAESFGQMLRAGLRLPRIFEVLLRHRRSRRAREAIEAVRDHTLNGGTFYEGFAARADVWPRYFIELIRCTERAGALHAGLEEGADHFRKLALAWRAAHMLWISPVCIILFGWLARGVIRIIWKGWANGLSFWWGCLETILSVAVPVLLLLFLPPLRRWVDRALLHVPILGETARDLALYQFTTCFRYLYIGAIRAPEIVRFAAGAVGNRHLRRRLTATADEVENGRTFAEALTPATHWPGDYIAQLATAELSGQLEAILEHLARQRKEAMEMRVQTIRQISDRLVAYVTIVTITFEIAALAR